MYVVDFQSRQPPIAQGFKVGQSVGTTLREPSITIYSGPSMLGNSAYTVRGFAISEEA
jgi:hypothetical protein